MQSVCGQYVYQTTALAQGRPWQQPVGDDALSTPQWRDTVYYKRSVDGGNSWIGPEGPDPVIPGDGLNQVYVGEPEFAKVIWYWPAFYQKAYRRSTAINPRIAVAPDGTVHVVFSGSSDSPFTTPNPPVTSHSYYTSTWSAPEASGGLDETGSLNARQWTPDFAIGSDNKVHLVWIARDANVDDKVYYRYWDNTTAALSSTDLVSHDGVEDTILPSIAVAQDQTVRVSWNIPSATMITGTIYHRYKESTQTWPSNDIVRVSGAGTTTGTADLDSDVAVADDGTAYLAWIESGVLVFAEKPDGSFWSNSISIPGVVSPTLNTGCSFANGPGLGVHLAFMDGGDVYYVQIVPPSGGTVLGEPIKRYFAGEQQLATRLGDGTLAYHLNDPTGMSLTMADAGGNVVGQVLYDAYGGVLANTLPMSLTGSLPDVPDAATGLVHLGDGRWYDPALGRPLQPNSAGGPPTLPQALNRYTATAVGQPGVVQASQGDGCNSRIRFLSRGAV